MWTRNYAQIDELLAPVSTFLQAALMKQALAEYGINPTNTTSKSNPIFERQLNQILEAILRVELNYGQTSEQINKTLKADTTEAQPDSSWLATKMIEDS